MALPASGLITAAMINQELGRASNAALSLNDPAVRALAGKPSGAISFSDFHGKSSEIVVTVSSNLISAATNMVSLFGSADWASATNKRLVINSGVRVRRLYITTAFGGTLTIENHGIIEGEGGAANGGAGGYGFYTNQGSPSTLKLINNGTIRGGGGGGGKGGTGGTGGGGTATQTVREPASGYAFNDTATGWFWVGPALFIMWNNEFIGEPANGNVTSYSAGGFTYYRGAHVINQSSYDAWSIYRQGTQTVNTNGGAGGAGGNGGRGIGSDQSRTNGSAGAAGSLGGTNAGRGGTGGTGGNGGDWGAAGTQGNTGATGQAGNRTSGSAGSAGAAGGRGGYSIQGYNRVDYSGSGTLQGATANT